MLEAKHISKQFGGVKALTDVNLKLYPGKVNAIIGENGAGKSTLMKIFSGVHTEYGGEILLNEKNVCFAGTKDAEAAGIAIIHQELNLVPYLTITENIFLGSELVNHWGLLDKKQMQDKTRQLLKKLNLGIHPDTKIASLKVGQQQLVEIAKALHIQADVIIMDEPTSAISDKEADNLFSIIAQLKAEGKTIAYISHKLKELFAVADKYVILRDGQTVDAGDMKSVSQDELIHKMTGRQLGFEKSGRTINEAPVLLSVKNLCLRHWLLRFTNVLNNISFDLHKGEILGVYGLMGAGRTEMLETIFGLHPKNGSGTIIVNDQDIKIKSPAGAIVAGIALVPEDRKLHGLILNQTVKSNISITVLKQLERWRFLLSSGKEKELSKNYINQLGIKTASDMAAAKSLSGGNQQKIVLAKWMATHPQVLLLDEPTRGVDINAKAEIYKLMKSMAARGIGIVMVSSELPEILAVSDRVLVMCEGKLTANIAIEEATEAGILKYALHKTETIA
ncbi:MAG: sugar ABC transporter ATP-binding protein [Sphingobacteriales bacterium]|nr:sugar ABC transporter ATP-binding protein [Sphingobacteriales bacterium]